MVPAPSLCLRRWCLHLRLQRSLRLRLLPQHACLHKYTQAQAARSARALASQVRLVMVCWAVSCRACLCSQGNCRVSDCEGSRCWGLLASWQGVPVLRAPCLFLPDDVLGLRRSSVLPSSSPLAFGVFSCAFCSVLWVAFVHLAVFLYSF